MRVPSSPCGFTTSIGVAGIAVWFQNVWSGSNPRRPLVCLKICNAHDKACAWSSVCGFCISVEKVGSQILMQVYWQNKLVDWSAWATTDFFIATFFGSRHWYKQGDTRNIYLHYVELVYFWPMISLGLDSDLHLIFLVTPATSIEPALSLAGCFDYPSTLLKRLTWCDFVWPGWTIGLVAVHLLLWEAPAAGQSLNLRSTLSSVRTSGTWTLAISYHAPKQQSHMKPGMTSQITTRNR